jgi:hypothetical protein
MRRRSAHVKELNMENICGPDRGEFVRAEGSTPFDGPDGPTRTGRTLERPARLEEGDMVEAVSRAVLRELEGGVSLDVLYCPHTPHIWGMVIPPARFLLV